MRVQFHSEFKINEYKKIIFICKEVKLDPEGNILLDGEVIAAHSCDSGMWKIIGEEGPFSFISIGN